MIININKPIDWSSFDVVKKIRNITKHKKVGHGGTLDPFATGVLMIGTENDTKSLSLIANTNKTYEAELTLGKTTNTLDTEGEVISEIFIPDINLNFIIDILNSFIGHQKQSPPMFSAKKHKGVRLYNLARKGIEVKREDIDILIKKIEFMNHNSSRFRLYYILKKLQMFRRDIFRHSAPLYKKLNLQTRQLVNYNINNLILA